MSVEREAAAAARAAYPDADAVAMVCEGKPVGVMVAGNPVHAMARTPYAQGYQAGYAAARALAAESVTTVIESKWVCTKCARFAVLGHDDEQIPEHHRTCKLRPRPKHGEPGHTPSYDCGECNE